MSRARLGQRAVLAEHHAAQQRGLRRRQPRAQGRVGTRADRVDHAGRARRAGARRRHGPSAQLGVDPARGVARLARGQRLEAAANLQHGADARAPPADAPRRPHEHVLAAERRDRDPHPEGPATRRLQQRRAAGQRVSNQRPSAVRSSACIRAVPARAPAAPRPPARRAASSRAPAAARRARPPAPRAASVDRARARRPRRRPPRWAGRGLTAAPSA